jgi:hypothetical protein
MSQCKPSSLSNRLRVGGVHLRRSYPVTGRNTFKPSGNPETDPPEKSRLTLDEYEREVLGLGTPQGRDAWDARVRSSTH